MPQTVTCPHCGGGMQASDEQAGTVVTCPHCRQTLTVPQPGVMPPPLPPPVAEPYMPPKPTSVGVIIAIVVGGVVLVLMVLAAFLLPALAKAQEAARRARCMNNVRQIGLAMFQYAGDHDDHFMPLPTGSGDGAIDYAGTVVPSGTYSRSGFAVLLHDGYFTTTKVFICPSSKQQVDPTFPTDYKNTSLAALSAALTDSNCSYGWDPTKKHSVDACCAIVADKPLAYPPGPAGDIKDNSPNHGGGETSPGEGQNVFYNDGHVKWGTTPMPDSGDDADIYRGDAGYETSNTDAKIIR